MDWESSCEPLQTNLLWKWKLLYASLQENWCLGGLDGVWDFSLELYCASLDQRNYCCQVPEMSYPPFRVFPFLKKLGLLWSTSLELRGSYLITSHNVQVRRAGCPAMLSLWPSFYSKLGTIRIPILKIRRPHTIGRSALQVSRSQSSLPPEVRRAACPAFVSYSCFSSAIEPPQCAVCSALCTH